MAIGHTSKSLSNERIDTVTDLRSRITSLPKICRNRSHSTREGTIKGRAEGEQRNSFPPAWQCSLVFIPEGQNSVAKLNVGRLAPGWLGALQASGRCSARISTRVGVPASAHKGGRSIRDMPAHLLRTNSEGLVHQMSLDGAVQGLQGVYGCWLAYRCGKGEHGSCCCGAQYSPSRLDTSQSYRLPYKGTVRPGLASTRAGWSLRNRCQ